MKLTERERRAYELGLLEAQRASAHALAGSLRGAATQARQERATGTLLARMRHALFWEVTQAWCLRLDDMAMQLDGQAAGLESKLKALRMELAQARFLDVLRGKRKA